LEPSGALLESAAFTIPEPDLLASHSMSNDAAPVDKSNVFSAEAEKPNDIDSR
jgi:hypothetical protein